MVLHLCFNWILAYAAGKRLAEERQSGGFEVLLTVPLEPKTIVDGQCRALLTQFRVVWVGLFLLDALLCASAFALPGWTTHSVIVLLLAWAAFMSCWFAVHLEAASRAMWISTWTGRPAYSARQSSSGSLGWFILLLWFSRGSIPPPLVAPATWLVVILSVVLCFGAFVSLARRGSLREKLARELRLIACAPIPAREDKRFKKWDPNLIHPPGRWGELVLQPARRQHSHPRRTGDQAAHPQVQ